MTSFAMDTIHNNRLQIIRIKGNCRLYQLVMIPQNTLGNYYGSGLAIFKIPMKPIPSTQSRMNNGEDNFRIWIPTNLNRSGDPLCETATYWGWGLEIWTPTCCSRVILDPLFPVNCVSGVAYVGVLISIVSSFSMISTKVAPNFSIWKDGSTHILSLALSTHRV